MVYALDSDFNINKYIADILLNADYDGAATGTEDGLTSDSKWLDFYTNPANASPSRLLVQNLKKDDVFMNSVGTWKLLTFDPSSLVNDALDETGFYEAILFRILHTRILDAPSAVKDAERIASNSISLVEGFSKVMESRASQDYITIANEPWGSLDYALQNELIQETKKQLTVWENRSNSIGDLATIIDTSKSVAEYIAQTCAYAQLVSVSEDIKAVLLDMYENCPSDNLPMKHAIYSVYTVCGSSFNETIQALKNGGFLIANLTFEYLVDKAWNSCISALGGGLGKGLLIGQAVGKTVSDFLFSTDTTIEQFYMMDAMVNFENEMSATVIRLGQNYKANRTEANAKKFLAAVDLMASAYELDCDYAADFAETVLTAGIVNHINSMFGENLTAAKFRESVSLLKKTIGNFHTQILSISSYQIYLEEDYPNVTFDKPGDLSSILLRGSANLINSSTIQLVSASSSHTAGTAWWPVQIVSPTSISVEFEYCSTGGGDGFAVWFDNEIKNPTTGITSGLNASSYAVEWDGYVNSEYYDFNTRHIAVIQGAKNNHLQFVGNTALNDGLWHTAKVVFSVNSITVLVDGQPILSYDSNITLHNRGYIGVFAYNGAARSDVLIKNYQVSVNQNSYDDYPNVIPPTVNPVEKYFITPIDTPDPNAIKIYTAQDLDNMRNNLNGSYVLMNDIDLSTFKGGEWVPIGSNNTTSFKGVFDGQGYTIYNLRINNEAKKQDLGLFGYISSANVILKNVALVNVSIVSPASTIDVYAGSLVGRATHSSVIIDNCFSTGTIKTHSVGTYERAFSAHVGGLIGHSVGKIRNSYSSCKVEAIGSGTPTYECAGGLAGYVVDVQRCYATGDVLVSNMYGGGMFQNAGALNAGGLLGYSGSVVTESFASGNVNSTSNDKYLDANIGGLVGRSESTVISNSYAVGIISADTKYSDTRIGGLVGFSNNATINNCYFSGEVNATAVNHIYTPKTWIGAAGLVGHCKPTVTNITNSLVLSSKINASSSLASDELVCYTAGTGVLSMTNVLALQNISGNAINNANARISLDDAKKEMTYANLGWDFDDIWGINANTNNGYPYLRALNTGGVSNNKTITIPIRSFLSDETGKSLEFPWKFTYDDNYFSKSSYDYNHDLAKMSLGMAIAGYSSVESDVHWGENADVGRESYIADAFNHIGFDNDTFTDDSSTRWFRNYNISLNYDDSKVAIAIAKKTIYIDGSPNTLISVVLRGGGYGSEWADNFNITGGEPGYHAGFYEASRKASSYVRGYITKLIAESRIEGDVKLWITGYSRSAAVANLLAASLDKYYKQNPGQVALDNIYTYTFATPQNVIMADHPNDFTDAYINGYIHSKETFDNIYNIINPADFVPQMVLSDWGFARYGINKYFPAYTPYTLESSAIPEIQTQYDAVVKMYRDIVGESDSFMAYESSKQWLLVIRVLELLYSLEPNIEQVGTEGLQDVLTAVFHLLQIRGQKTGTMDEWSTELDILYSLSYKYDTSVVTTYLARRAAFQLALHNQFTNSQIEIIAAAVTVAEAINFNLISYLGHLSDNQLSSSADLIDQLLTLWGMFDNPDKSYDPLQAHYPELYTAWMFAIDGDELINRTLYYKKVSVACPVDVRVFDSHNNLMASIIDNQVIVSVLPVEINGESKDIYLFDDNEYHIEITATDNGKMDYSITEFGLGNTQLRKVLFNNISLTTGENISGGVDNIFNTAVTNYNLHSDAQGVLQANDDLAGDAIHNLDIIINYNDGGFAIGTSKISMGDIATVKAMPFEGYAFDGWYECNAKLDNMNAKYSFTALTNRTLEARFISNSLSNDENIAVADDKVALTWSIIQGRNVAENNVTANLATLPLTGASGTTITWSSDTPAVISNTGVVTQPSNGSGDATVTLTATISKGTASDTVVFTLTVKELPTPTVTSVTVSPTVIEIQQGGTQQFAATVTGTSNPVQSVDWTVENAISASTTITSGGALTVGADETADTLTVRASSAIMGYTDVSGTAIVTVSELLATIYDVTVIGSYAGTSGAGSYAQGATVTINAGNRSDYSFNGWSATGVNLVNPGDATTTFTMLASVVNVTASWTYTGGGSYYPPDSGSTTPTNPPFTPPVTESAQTPATPPKNEDITIIGGNNVTTPKGQEPVPNPDGSATLPGGGTITVPGDNNGKGGVAIATPPGTTVTEDGKISFPSGSGGGMITHDSGHSFDVDEDAVIILDADIPLGYYIVLGNPFTDINESAWYYNSVMFAYTHGLMVGTNTDPMMFSPNMTTTRGMIVTTLYRMAGSPDVRGLANPFFDVAGYKWYSDAVVWAVTNGIVSGYSSGLYGPEDNITREQLAVILNNYIDYSRFKLPEIREYKGFNDDADCANYAKEAIERFFKAGIVSGKPGNVFDPKGNATRAEVATMLMNFLEAIENDGK